MAPEVSRFNSLSHPYPADILSYIFLLDVTSAAYKDRFKESTSLSHVCRQWRWVALDTPRLWTWIDCDMKREAEAIREYMERTSERVRTIPCIIDVKSIGEEGSAGMENCLLERFPDIVTLLLDLTGPLAIREITKQEFLGTKGKVFNLELRGEPVQEWDFGGLMAKFPKATNPTFWQFWGGSVKPGPQLNSIEHLNLHQTKKLDLLTLCSLLPHLTELILYESDGRRGPSQTTKPIILPHLRYLCLESIWGIEWLRQLECPALEELKVEAESSTTEALHFIMRHRTITTLFLGSMDNVEQLPLIAPQLHQLSLLYCRDFLYTTCHGCMSQPSFPDLRTLRIHDLEPGLRLNKSEFEQLVERRCLPPTHARSRLIGSLKPLESLIIVLDDKTRMGEWMDSPLYQEAKKVVEADMEWGIYDCVILSWP